MSRKPKFKPVITRIKLNPEQAVLACACYAASHVLSGTAHNLWNYAIPYVICTGRTWSNHSTGCAGSGPGTAIGLTGSAHNS